LLGLRQRDGCLRTIGCGQTGSGKSRDPGAKSAGNDTGDSQK